MGVFGDHEALVLVFPDKLDGAKLAAHGQDLAGDIPVDITRQVAIRGNRLVISGVVIRGVARMAVAQSAPCAARCVPGLPERSGTSRACGNPLSPIVRFRLNCAVLYFEKSVKMGRCAR